MSRARESFIKTYRSQGTKYCFEDYFLNDDLMSTRIVLLMEGHDESHIDDTKLGTKSWNFVDDVTIGLNKKLLTQRLF